MRTKGKSLLLTKETRFEFEIIESAYPSFDWSVNGIRRTEPLWDILNESGILGYQIVANDISDKTGRTIILQRVINIEKHEF